MSRHFFLLTIFLTLASLKIPILDVPTKALAFSPAPKPGGLKVSGNRRFLVKDDGTPFFWLGDSAQSLLYRLSREDVDLYLQTRKDQGFNVIQTQITTFFGINATNYYGNTPFIGGDPRRINEPFWQHVDYVINKAASLGLIVALVPDRNLIIDSATGSPGPLDATSAYSYGQFVGQRYLGKPVVWVLGWDVPPFGREAVFTALADGIAQAQGGHGNALITFHTSPTGPFVGHSSSYYFNGYHWLDFNSAYSSHRDDNQSYGFPETYEIVESDYNLSPTRPVVDMEPPYEHVFDGVFDGRGSSGPRMKDDVIRRKAYWSVFAGAFGYTFGNIDVVAFYGGRNAVVRSTGASRHWKEAIYSPAATQMQYLRKLIESRSQLVRIPDQSMIVGDAGTGLYHIRSTRASDGSYAFVYIPDGRSVTVNMGSIIGPGVHASWFDPRTGAFSAIGQFCNAGIQNFDPPGNSSMGNDWVLVLDTLSRTTSPCARD